MNGIITDPSGAVVSGAQVTLTDESRGTSQQARTNSRGFYSLPFVQPGTYVLIVESTGFNRLERKGVVVGTAQALALNARLQVGDASQTVNVSANNGMIATTNDSPGVSLTVSREFVESMPLNGRSFQDLIQLAPGAVSTGGMNAAPGYPAGYYSINGQRTDGNNFTVDGVSANLGGWVNSNDSAGLSGVAPAQSVLGTTQSLASVDSLQEFTIQTSGFTAEYGRNPGGQIQFTTRSGTNDLHGTLFEYLRNTAFDANSWANDYYGLPQTAEHQNDFGGTVGGPVILPHLYNGKNRTFYFFSYEGLRLSLPAFQNEFVPTAAFRKWAAPGVQPFLNSIPLPNPSSPGNVDGCTIPDPDTGQPTACDARFTYGYSYPNSLDNISLRIDQSFGERVHVFLRYADTPSSQTQGAEIRVRQGINTHSWTAGLTATLANNLLTDLRFNSSHDGEGQFRYLQPIHGGVPWSRNLLIPSSSDGPYAVANILFFLPGTSLVSTSVQSGKSTLLHQYQIVDGTTWTKGKHSLKFGADWRQIAPTINAFLYYSTAQFASLNAIQQGRASLVRVGASAPGKPILNNLSLYAQDHFIVTPSLSIDYGVRWEFNPPPGPSNGYYPLTLTTSDLAQAQLASVGTQPYKTNYHSFAPRLGFSWNVDPRSTHPTSIRGGFGIFFDTGQNSVANSYYNTYPFSVFNPTTTNVLFPLSKNVLAPPALNAPLAAPYPMLQLTDPDLTLPYTEQWNLSVDRALNSKNTLTVSYVGNNGRKLLFTQYYGSLPNRTDFTSLDLSSNAAQSGYNALQIQDSGRLARDLDLVASFSWAHSLDNASNSSSDFAPLYGNSDYDIRRVLNLALNYQTPGTGANNWGGRVTHGWLLANRFSAQSGYPLNIVQSEVFLPDGTQAEYSPDRVPGVPIYLHGRAADVGGSTVPGSWRLNRAAFACTTSGVTDGACLGTPTRQGTLGRNYIRNPSFWTLNTSLQRTFPLYERLRADFRAEAFNLFNHPNPSGPYVDSLGQDFGQLVNGQITTIGSSNALYGMGASRSLQLSLHLQF